MKFSIVSNQGLRLVFNKLSIILIDKALRYFQRPAILNENHISHNLGGVVGQNLIPHDYHVDETGNIMLKGKFSLIN